MANQGGSFFVYIQEAVTGLTIQNNTFTGSPDIGMEIVGTVQNLRIIGNTIQEPVVNSEVIDIGTGPTATMTCAGNVISTGGIGFGLVLSTLNISVEGNDLRNNKVGVDILGGAGSASGIDLGGGSQGSLGGNNFRGFTTPNAIETGSGSGTIFAQHNIFSVAMPSSVTTQGSITIDPSINTTNLTGKAAFVETLYIDFLHRAGDTTNANDAGFWVSALAGGSLTQAQVASGLVRSVESLTDIVDGLYLAILGRPFDSAGRAAWIRFLQQGHTLEQTISGFFTSVEYGVLTASNNSYVESLYNELLGRKDDTSGFNFWLSKLPSIGRAGVAAAFVDSTEFRTDAVQQLFTGSAVTGEQTSGLASAAALLPNMLHRSSPPSKAEVNSWVNSGLDLLSIEVDFANSSEFFNNG